MGNFPFRKMSSSQYSVSEHSFKAISNLLIKSARLCAYLASWIFAPIDEEERTTWLTKTAHPLISSQRSDTRIANSMESSRNWFFVSFIFASLGSSCRYVRLGRTRYMVALRPFDILRATRAIRYVAYGNERGTRAAPSRPAGHIELRSNISSRRHIERRVSGAYRLTKAPRKPK